MNSQSSYPQFLLLLYCLTQEQIEQHGHSRHFKQEQAIPHKQRTTLITQIITNRNTKPPTEIPLN